jgi:hypothetical protein
LRSPVRHARQINDRSWCTRRLQPKTAFPRFSAVHKADLEGQQWVEAVRKRDEFLRLAEQSEVLRGFLDSERPEGSKKRTK